MSAAVHHCRSMSTTADQSLEVLLILFSASHVVGLVGGVWLVEKHRVVDLDAHLRLVELNAERVRDAFDFCGMFGELLAGAERVDWLVTRPYDEAFKEPGLYGSQNSACRPVNNKWRHTVKRLKLVFEGWDRE